MKKHLRLIVVLAALLAFVGCQKQEVSDLQGDGDALKDWVYTTELYAGQHILVGSVTFLDDENGNFRVTYTLDGGWTMSESHVYLGLVDDLPLNGPGAPKIGKFPFKEVHDPAVTSYTYVIPSDGLPPAPDYTDLAVAAHAVVNNPDGGDETAWAACDYTFADRGWGTWSYFAAGAEHIPDDEIFYAIQQTADGSLVLVYIHLNSGEATIILSELVASGGGEATAAAYDPITGNLFFVIGNELYVTNLNDGDPSELITTLLGQPVGGTFLNGSFYYFNNDPLSAHYGEIIQVQISPDGNGGWTIIENPGFSSNLFNDLIGYNLVISDMTISEDGTIHLIGTDDNGTPYDTSDDIIYLVTYTAENGYVAEPTLLIGDAKITYGQDGQLYAFHFTPEGDPVIEILDPASPGSPPVPPGTDTSPPLGGDIGAIDIVAGSDLI